MAYKTFIQDTINQIRSGFQLNISYVLVFCVVIAASYYILSNKRRLKLPPGPVGLPFVGYLPFLGPEPYKTLNDLAKKYGNIFSFYLGQQYVVILNDWQAVTDALGQSATVNRPAGLFDLIPHGFGFNGASFNEWVEQRRSSVKAMRDIGLGRPRWEQHLQEEVNDTINQILLHKNEPLDITDLLGATFANNIMTLLLGHRMPFGHPDTKYLSDTIDMALQAFPVLHVMYFMPWFGKLLLRMGLVGSSDTPEKLLKYHEFVKKIAKQRLESKDSDDDDSFVKRFIVETEILRKNDPKAGNRDYNLYGNTQILILAGGETSRTAVSWLLFAVAQNQKIQEKLVEEINEFMANEGEVTWSKRMKLPYTYACILEALRWKTTVPINTQRMNYEDIKIQGYDIPKHTTIIANNWALHNDPRFWKEPELFNPERFIEPDGKVRLKADSFNPFSYGKRACPGETIAMMEILFYFTMLIYKFNILPVDGSATECKTILGLTHQVQDLKLRFVPRRDED